MALDSVEGPGVGADATRHAKAHRMALARRRAPQVTAPAPEPRRVRPAASDRGSDDDSSGDELDLHVTGQARKAPEQLPMSIADKVRLCAATEKDRVMFGKVRGMLPVM